MAKLVEILARELGEWPEGAAFVVQDSDGEVKYQFSDEEPDGAYEGVWIRRMRNEPDVGFICYMRIATDHTTAIVTREMWQTERAKLAKRSK